MAIPDFQKLLMPALKLSAQGEQRFGEAVRILSDQFQLTDEEKQQTVPNRKQSMVGNRVGWAITYLVKAGLVERPARGIFRITERGQQVLSDPPEKLTKQFLYQYYGHKAQQKSRTSSDESSEQSAETPESDETAAERISKAYQELTEALKDELLESVLRQPPEFFEELIVQLLLAMGYGGSREEAGQRVGQSGDGGIDGIISEDKLGLSMIYLQAKRYATHNQVGRPEIQQFSGSLMGQGANKGVFVTTSRFSPQAYEYIQTIPQQSIILIDGSRLTSLMIEYDVGVRLDQAILLKKIDEDFFPD
ncbi:MAG: restriction endonuclease [Gammaproteobacteria bacterium]